MPSTVKLDGTRLKRLREEKSLTQLYVAEVVGVTVDTVSRWENNRTASVRRENVTSLAAALGVEPTELLRREEEAEGREPAPTEPVKTPHPARNAYRLFAAALLPLGLLVGWYYFSQGENGVSSRRFAPSYLAPGTLAPVGITVSSPDRSLKSVVVSETLPPGWLLTGANPQPDSGSPADNSYKWILPLADGAAVVTYVVKAPDDGKESSRHRFSGAVVSAREGSGEASTLGGNSVDLEYVHWADGDADFRIDDGEVLRALELLDRVRDLGPDPADLRRLWGAGVYRWDAGRKGFFVGR